MNNWRILLGFDEGEDLDFSTVHDRYRELMVARPLEPERVLEITAALNEARLQLGTGRAKGN